MENYCPENKYNYCSFFNFENLGKRIKDKPNFFYPKCLKMKDRQLFNLDVSIIDDTCLEFVDHYFEGDALQEFFNRHHINLKVFESKANDIYREMHNYFRKHEMGRHLAANICYYSSLYLMKIYKFTKYNIFRAAYNSIYGVPFDSWYCHDFPTIDNNDIHPYKAEYFKGLGFNYREFAVLFMIQLVGEITKDVFENGILTWYHDRQGNFIINSIRDYETLYMTKDEFEFVEGKFKLINYNIIKKIRKRMVKLVNKPAKRIEDDFNYDYYSDYDSDEDCVVEKPQHI